MYRYKRVLVAVDLTENDSTLVKYAAMLSKMAESEKVYFCHVAKNLDISDALYEKYPELIEPLDESIEEKLKKNITKLFDGHNSTQIQIDVAEGNILYELLKHIKRKKIDLVLVGKKMGKKFTSKLAEKLCRKAPCSVLVIPENADIQLSGILVPIDFSENSADAMDVALSFGSAAGLKAIDCVNVFKLPIGYYKTGKTEEQFTEIVRKNAKIAYQKFIQNIDTKGVQINDMYAFSSDTIEGLEHIVSENPYDLIVLGAQGRSAGAAILLGSVTEQLIWSATIPVLAAKQKGAGMRLLDAILKL